jgi:hypothetical protein
LADVLAVLDAIRAMVPPFLDTFNVVMAAAEHIAFRLTMAIFFLYGLFRTIRAMRRNE